MRNPDPLPDRFWRFVTPVDGCWLWRGNRNQAGYGQIKVGRKGPSVSAHRLSYELHHGPIPAGLFVLHRCDNPPCVNPDHLFVGTAKDNSDDMIAKGRRAKHVRPHSRVRKLTDDQVLAIRLDGRALYIVAGEFDVSEATISMIRTGRRKGNVA